MGTKTLTQHIDDIRKDLAVWLLWDTDPDADWTDEDIERAINRAYSDLSRFLPRELFYEVTLNFSVSNESFTTAAHGTYVNLANKPISKATPEVVKNVAGTTTYKRDTDYTMDYINGRITTISGGSMAVSTAYIVTYTKSKIAIDLSSLSPIRVDRVEYPGHEVPQKSMHFSTWGDILFVESNENTQENMSDAYHIVIYYHSMHTVPELESVGTCPAVLEDTINLAAEAYCLFNKSSYAELAAFSDLKHAREALENLAGLHSAAEEALDKVSTNVTESDTALDKVSTYAAAAVTALDAIDAKITSATNALGNLAALHTLVGTDLTSGGTALAAAVTDLNNMSTPLAAIATALAKVDTYLAGNSESTKALLAQIATDVASLRTAIATAVDAAKTALGLVTSTDFTNAAGEWTDEASVLTTLAGYLTTGSPFINACNIGADVAAMYANYLSAHVNIQRSWAQKRADLITIGNARTQQAATYLQEAQIRLANLSTYIEQARGYGAISDGFIAEANQRIGHCNALASEANQHIGVANGYISSAGMRLYQMDRYLEEATRYISIGELLNNEAAVRLSVCDKFVSEANQRIGVANANIQEGQTIIAEMDRYIEEATRYTEAAAADLQLADRYKAEGTDKRSEVYNIWQDGKHFVGNLSSVAIQQVRSA